MFAAQLHHETVCRLANGMHNFGELLTRNGLGLELEARGARKVVKKRVYTACGPFAGYLVSRLATPVVMRVCEESEDVAVA